MYLSPKNNRADLTPAELLQQFTRLRAELNQTIQALEAQVEQETTARVVAMNGFR